MRMSLAVIRNVVVTVRLPDLLCAGRLSARQFSSRPRGAIRIPDRFFPSGLDVAAEDVADTIALHQATTARAVSEEVRLKLEEVEDRWSPDSGDRERQHRDALEDARQVTEITETVQQLDAQLSRLLRRFGSHGDRADAEGTLPEIKLRYRFALDELRSLLADCRLASETVGRGIASSEQNDRERFHFVAAILGAAILFPTLVASVYGANVALPAQNSWGGFIALLLFISAFALAGLLAISEAWEKGWVPSGERMLRGRLRSAAVVYAALAFAIGVVIVVTG
jgi:Mg2+ and Co2+ transporter CorA